MNSRLSEKIKYYTPKSEEFVEHKLTVTELKVFEPAISWAYSTFHESSLQSPEKQMIHESGPPSATYVFGMRLV